MGAAGVDYLAVAIAAVAAFAFGSIYYMTLGRAWLAALGRSSASMKTGSPPPLR